MQDEWVFEWDPAKSAANRRKHGIPFEEARAMWDDPYCFEFPLNSYPEQRWALVAQMSSGYYTAIITYRGEKTVRIISVSKSTKREVDIYAKH